MYQHHIDSLQNMVDYFKAYPGVIALIFDGSVSKGLERPDSDLDAIVVVTDEQYAIQVAEHRTAECIFGHSTYEGGYFDVKYIPRKRLDDVLARGSEPAKATFWKSQVLFTSDPTIPEVVEKIATFNMDQYEEKMLTFYANIQLNQGYFFGCLSDKDCYMRLHVISETIYSVYRMILQENHVLFSCNRKLESQVLGCESKPEGIVELARQLAAEGTQEACDRFVAAYMAWTSHDFSKYSPHEAHSKYVKMYEEWWNEGTNPFINEW